MTVDILSVAIHGAGYLLPGRYDGLIDCCNKNGGSHSGLDAGIQMPWMAKLRNTDTSKYSAQSQEWYQYKTRETRCSESL